MKGSPSPEDKVKKEIHHSKELYKRDLYTLKRDLKNKIYDSHRCGKMQKTL